MHLLSGIRVASAPNVPPKVVMWNWIICYVTGHDYSVSCNDNSMYLRCISCGRRSHGWVVREHAQ